jgi:uncharacterized protein YjdB
MKAYKLLSISVLLICLIIGCKQTPIEVSSVSLNTATIEMVEGDTYSLVATVQPSNAEYEGISWASSNTSVASVNQGTVTALKEGKTTITASAGGKSATCSVTVSAKYIAVTSITLDKSELSLEVNNSDVITATVKPDNATDKSVKWSSSDASIVKVDNGKVTALKSGTTTITAECGGKKAECEITATVSVAGIALDKTELTIAVGETSTLKATVIPDDATDKVITWYSSDTEIATVKDGVVTALKIGTATITATAGDKTAKCIVTVWGNINFKDNTVKKACVAKFDTNDDGEISYEEASAVTDLTGLFANYREITSFDELIYFDNVSELPDRLFRHCDKLKSVSIPSSVSRLGYECFAICTSLTDIKIPSSVTTLGDRCFIQCKSLDNINIPSSVTELGQGCFCYCKSLTDIALPASIDKIPNDCFLLCSSLASIDIPSSVTSLGNNCFSCCTSLASINIPSSVTTLGNGCFSGSDKLSTLRCNATSVPLVGDSVFYGTKYTSDGDLYVPEESIELYKNADQWRDWKHIEKL